MQGTGEKSVVWIMEFSFQAYMIMRDASRDFRRLEKAVGYGIECMKKQY
jgi:hypothetical protein